MIDQDEQLDRLLGGHLRRELDSQLGRASLVFSDRASARRMLMFRIVGAASALAACLVIAILVIAKIHEKTPIANRNAPSHSEIPSKPESRMERLVSWVDIDGGPVVMSDNTPARCVRRQLVEQLIFHDAEQRTTVEMTLPQEEVIYVPLRPF